MKGISIFILFIGIILIIQAYYIDKNICPKPITVIKYVPRSIYEEQLSEKEKLDLFYKGMFENNNLNENAILEDTK